MEKIKPMLSLVIPAKNEEESVEILYKELVDVLDRLKEDYEIIFVDDGSTDSTFEVLKNLQHHNKKIKLVRHRGNWGKSIALQNGFDKARGEIIMTLDADLQDNPQDISAFLKKKSWT